MSDEDERKRLIALILEACERCPTCGSAEVDEPPAEQAPPLIRVMACLNCGQRWSP